MKLQTKFLLSIAAVLLASFVTRGFVHYQDTGQEVLRDLQKEAGQIRGVLMATRRVYYHQFLDSGIALTDKTIGFLPAHAMKKISDDSQNWFEGGLSFNNVSDRPRNPDNAADAVELEAIRFFRADSKKEMRFVSYENRQGEPFYHYARPIRVEQYCLKCHGKREDAPAVIRANYDTAFDYQVGELRGIMSIKLPVRQLEARVWGHVWRIFTVDLVAMLVLFLLISWLLRRYITGPLDNLTGGLQAVGDGKFEQSTNGLTGELAAIGHAYRQMSQQIKEREAELKSSEARIRLLLDSTAEAIYGIDIQGDCTFANPACLSMLGYEDAGEVLGRNMHGLMHHTRSDGSPYPVQECRVHEAIVKGEGTHVDDEVLWHKDGTSFAAEYWAYPIHQDGKVTGAVVAFWDISERRQNEEALKQRLDELERYQKATVNREFRIKELRDEIVALKKGMDVARDEGS